MKESRGVEAAWLSRSEAVAGQKSGEDGLLSEKGGVCAGSSTKN